MMEGKDTDNIMLGENNSEVKKLMASTGMKTTIYKAVLDLVTNFESTDLF